MEKIEAPAATPCVTSDETCCGARCARSLQRDKLDEVGACSAYAERVSEKQSRTWLFIVLEPLRSCAGESLCEHDTHPIHTSVHSGRTRTKDGQRTANTTHDRFGHIHTGIHTSIEHCESRRTQEMKAHRRNGRGSQTRNDQRAFTHTFTPAPEHCDTD